MPLRDYLRTAQRYLERGIVSPWHLSSSILGAILRFIKSYQRCGIYYVVEGGGWVNYWVGESIIQRLRSLNPEIFSTICTSSRGLRNQIIHFGSLWSLKGNILHSHRSNFLVATIFHGHEGMDSEMREALQKMRESLPRLQAIITACTLMRDRLLKMGVPEEKLHLIPLGVDLQRFQPPSQEERWRKRKQLGIPEEAVCIGSFQKDGVGWGEGNEPKLIKGPDIFLKVVEQLSNKYPLFVLLTGPARGYVKKGLKRVGIPFYHNYLKDYLEITTYYHCLDLYLITSREEGGPMALLECMATGVPIISTRVGMAPDLIEQDVNGILVEIEDVEGITRAASRLIEDEVLKSCFQENALQKIKSYDWSFIVFKYYDQIYAPLLRS